VGFHKRRETKTWKILQPMTWTLPTYSNWRE
jgi:hypothetical protein